jgi:hypothetical protein
MRNREHADVPYAQPDATRGDWVPTLWDRLLWICPIVFLVAAAAVLWFFDLTLWAALGVGLLLACPVSIAWALLAERLGKPPRGAR